MSDTKEVMPTIEMKTIENRRVFYIDIGDKSTKEVANILRQIKSEFSTKTSA